MAKPLVLYKNEGETPLGCIERSRKEGKIAQGMKATYAGRLDPMAEGVLLVLTGDDVHEKENFLKLPKEYKVDVLLGISTDTADVLGLIKETKGFSFLSEEFREQIELALQKCVGIFSEDYPDYSSKPVGGVPLFSLARLGKIFSRPTHNVTISSVRLESMRMVKLHDISRESIKRIKKVEGDFRQQEITKLWEAATQEENKDVVILSIVVSCESGAYMRTLSEKIGSLVGYPALALRIVRTRVGEYTVS